MHRNVPCRQAKKSRELAEAPSSFWRMTQTYTSSLWLSDTSSSFSIYGADPTTVPHTARNFRRSGLLSIPIRPSFTASSTRIGLDPGT